MSKRKKAPLIPPPTPAPKMPSKPAAQTLMALLHEKQQQFDAVCSAIIQQGAKEAGLRFEDGWRLDLQSAQWVRVPKP